jgi:hypothetical protein
MTRSRGPLGAESAAETAHHHGQLLPVRHVALGSRTRGYEYRLPLAARADECEAVAASVVPY